MTSPAFFSAPQSLNHPHHRINALPPINHSNAKQYSSRKFSIRLASIDAGASGGSPIRRTRQRLTFSSLRASSDSTTIVDDPSVASSSSTSASVEPPLYSEEDDKAVAKIGSRVRVKVPLKVYHVPKVPEFELNGMEGVFKQYVPVWKGKRISANFPFKVAFVAEIEGRNGPVKFFAHLKEDEFEFLD